MSSVPFDIIDSLEILICGLDDTGTIHVFNRPCERLTGRTRDQAVGTSWLDIFAVGDRSGHVIALWRQAADETPSGPFEALCRNGRSIRWQFARTGTSAPVSLWAVGFDVTDERKSLMRSRQLERVVALGSLVSGLTHEMRNPLNGALLQLTLADRTLGRLDPAIATTAHAAVTQARTELRRMAALLDDFLVFVRPQPVQLERVDLRHVVARAAERSAQRARAADVTVEVESGTSVLAEVDAGRVEPAVYNLIVNAIDVAQAADHHVGVRVLDRGNLARVEVDDHGPGIPSTDVPIFEPFYSTKAGGTGLGLAIVQLVANDHQGTVRYERADRTTVFSLELPIVGGSVH